MTAHPTDPSPDLPTRGMSRAHCAGRVVEGRSRIIEAMETGEPLPVARHPGDRVIGGEVNQTGTLVLESVAVGSDTVLSRIIRQVEAAQGSQLPVRALLGRATLCFVPVVKTVAAATFRPRFWPPEPWRCLRPDQRLAPSTLWSPPIDIG